MEKQAVKKSSAAKVGKGCLLVILIPIILISILAGLDSWNRYKSGKASEDWPSTEGVIITSEVKTDFGKSDDVDPKHNAAITYRYTVDGTEYTGERISFAGQTFLKKGRADSLVMRYNVGKRVKVYYNPKTPHVSVLEPGTTSRAPTGMIAGLFILLIALLILFRVFRRKKEAPAPYPEVETVSQEPTHETAPESTQDAIGTTTGFSKPTAKQDKGLGIITLAMFAAGIVLLAWGGNELWRAYKSQTWPDTQGTITSSYIHKQWTRDSKSRSRAHYYPKVSYRYTVGGKSYSCNRIAFGGESGGKRGRAKKVVDRYPSGKKVTVYYNPQDPQVAVLKAGFSWGAILAFLAGLVFLVVGIVCLKAYRRQKGEQSAQDQPTYGTGPSIE
jgi:hypothetical protein